MPEPSVLLLAEYSESSGGGASSSSVVLPEPGIFLTETSPTFLGGGRELSSSKSPHGLWIDVLELLVFFSGLEPLALSTARIGWTLLASELPEPLALSLAGGGRLPLPSLLQKPLALSLYLQAKRTEF
jgi:hypothetical protein